jgi:hypothetical protein
MNKLLRFSLFWDVIAASVGSFLFVDVSGEPIGPVIKGQKVQRESIASLSKKGPTECPETWAN